MKSQDDELVAAPTYDQMLYQICEEEGIKLRFLSRNWMKRLEKDGQVRFIMGYKFGLNPQAAGLVADDKFATFEALSYAGIPVIQHEILYEFDNQSNFALGCNSLEYVLGLWRKWGGQMVIKANKGTCGRQVFKITQPDQLIEVLPKVFKQSYSASLCPFYNIKHEYRIVLLDGEEKLSYMKSKSSEDWFNLVIGAKADPIPAAKHQQILNLAQRAAREIGLRFGSVDTIETVDGELMVLEINSGVMAQHYVEQHPDDYPKVKEMYRAAIRKMFEEKEATKSDLKNS